MPTVLCAGTRTQTGDQIFPNRSPWTPAVTTGSPLQIRPGGQSHIGMPVYAGPIQSKRTLLNVPGLRPRVRKKAKISGFSVCDFLYFSFRTYTWSPRHQTRSSRQEEGAAMAYTLLRIFDEVDAQLSSEPRCTLRDQEAEFLLAGKKGKIPNYICVCFVNTACSKGTAPCACSITNQSTCEMRRRDLFESAKTRLAQNPPSTLTCVFPEDSRNETPRHDRPPDPRNHAIFS